MRLSAAAFILGAAALAANTAAAEQGHFKIGVTGGTLGVGPEIGYRANDIIGLRGNATFLKVSPTFSSDDIDYDGDVKLKSGGFMLDLFPFGGGFHVSAGGRINGNRADLTATPTADAVINGVSYTPAEIGTLSSGANTKDFAPMLSVGYGGVMRGGLTIGFEAGALFQGSVTIEDIQSSGGLVDLIDLEAERQSLQDDVNDYKVYPVLQLRLGYRF